jgi:hypothetical protein
MKGLDRCACVLQDGVRSTRGMKTAYLLGVFVL